MWYAILGRDAPDSLAKRMEARPAHLERMQKLREDGRVLLAGPLPAIDNEDPGPAGFVGSLMVLEFPNIEAARTWANEDPYVTAGVFESVDVYPFKPVLP